MFRVGEDLFFVGRASCGKTAEAAREEAFARAVRELRSYSQAVTTQDLATIETQMLYEEPDSEGCPKGTVSVWRLIRVPATQVMRPTQPSPPKASTPERPTTNLLETERDLSSNILIDDCRHRFSSFDKLEAFARGACKQGTAVYPGTVGSTRHLPMKTDVFMLFERVFFPSDQRISRQFAGAWLTERGYQVVSEEAWEKALARGHQKYPQKSLEQIRAIAGEELGISYIVLIRIGPLPNSCLYRDCSDQGNDLSIRISGHPGNTMLWTPRFSSFLDPSDFQGDVPFHADWSASTSPKVPVTDRNTAIEVATCHVLMFGWQARWEERLSQCGPLPVDYGTLTKDARTP